MKRKGLHQLLLNKWGRSYDVQLRQTTQSFVQIMGNTWSKPFPLTEGGYQAHLDTVASYVYAFGGTAQVQNSLNRHAIALTGQSRQHSSRFR